MKRSEIISFLIVSISLCLSTGLFGQEKQLWMTTAGGYNFQSARFTLKATLQYPSVRYITIGAELSHAGRNYGIWDLNTGEFDEKIAWITGSFIRVDYHPAYHWSSNPTWDPYVGIGGGVYTYFFEKAPGYYDFSIMLGTRYWIDHRWGIDFELGIREKIGFNLGVSYKFFE